MSVEKSWLAVPPQLFTADGTTLGIVTIANTTGFKVKMTVVIQSIAPASQVQVQIKRVISLTQLIVGPIALSLQPPQRQQGNQLLSVREDISAYTVASGALIYAGEQPKLPIDPKDIIQAVYEQEPTVAIRTMPVDPWGDAYDADNPLPVAFDGTVQIGDVSIVEGGNTMTVNTDGSINVNVVETPVSGQVVKSLYSQVLNIASGVETTLVTYTVPPGSTAVLEKVNVSGENIARYDVLYNAALFDTRRTMFGGNLTTDFDYTTGTSNGFTLNSGDIVLVQVIHNRPYTGSFNARIQVLEIA